MSEDLTQRCFDKAKEIIKEAAEESGHWYNDSPMWVDQGEILFDGHIPLWKVVEAIIKEVKNES